jgi:hypothetical protein
MWKTALPSAIPADLPRDVRLQIVSTCPEIPDGEGWLHEIKHLTGIAWSRARQADAVEPATATTARRCSANRSGRSPGCRPA